VIRGRHAERGATLVEFALSATFIFTVILGVIDFGRAMFTYDLIANAARLATRYAIVRGSTCNTSGCTVTAPQLLSYIQGVSPGIDTTKVTVTPVWTATNACSSPPNGQGCLVTVTVTYPFQFIAFPFAKFNMSSASQMLISQ
jgi:Flp pilus assembly protein TadG